MSKKLYDHIISINYNGIRDKIKQQSKTRKPKKTNS